MFAPSTICLSAYNALCAHGPHDADGIAAIIRAMGGTPIEASWIAAALKALEERDLVVKSRRKWDVRDPLRRIPFARDREGEGWSWVVRTPFGGAERLTDATGRRVAQFQQPGVRAP